jgi:hypothetical protein
MKTKALLASLAVSSLVLAQPAAAATRSYESMPAAGVQASAAVDRTGAAIGENEKFAVAESGWFSPRWASPHCS